MRVVLFTKLFESRPVEEVGERAAELGFDGTDLLIRHGFTIDPADPGALPDAVRSLGRAGLAVPMATTDITQSGELETRLIDLAGSAYFD